MTEYTGSGDPRRSLELLWNLREPASRGPRARLSVPDITAAAIALADAEGLAAVSMRRVAERLGVSAMSLYTYVPAKGELLDLMLDSIYGETEKPDRRPQDWRDRLEQVARQNWLLCRRHPWKLGVSTGRPPLGPNQMAKYDYELGALAGIGLSDLEMDSVLTMIIGYVEGCARRVVDADEVVRRTGLTDVQWWEASAPLVATLELESTFPLASRVGSASGEWHGAATAPEHDFEFGLCRVLDGIETLVRLRG